MLLLLRWLQHERRRYKRTTVFNRSIGRRRRSGFRIDARTVFCIRHCNSFGNGGDVLFSIFRFGKIRVAHLAFRHRILPELFAFVFPPETRRKNTKSKRPHLCRSMGQHRLRHRIEFHTVVFRQNRFFRRVFYHRHIDSSRMRYERRHRTKESEDYNVRRRRFLAFVRPVLSLCRAVHGPAYHKRGNFRFARNSRPYRAHHYAEKEVCR